ncbi:hypothetical protein [Pseudomonas caspiana]|uniref:Glycosyl transferase n=1 Tax=Pseudomonas caspiana TaxID=1451454 RepID=A0A1Y3P443_9PSED|nr:hypothetical protein [Pseudomonas caspiana]OUM72333.1 hypothetical protein AUC60_18445 [Pseudomonas caspiana]
MTAPISIHADDTDAVRIFVAATPAEWLPMKVLEFSIRERTALPVQLSAIYTHARAIPVPKDAANRARTPFSFQRFLIPELCGYKGRAIYMDADMQVFHDIAAVWNSPFNGSDLQTVSNGTEQRRPQFSVVLMDCARLQWNIEDIVNKLDNGTLSYTRLMFDMEIAESVAYSLPQAWNSLEYYEENITCLLHYTDMNTQPWVSMNNANGNLWVDCLLRALSCGFISQQELSREIEQGHVRPSLASQLSSGSIATWKPSIKDILSDIKFIPPFYTIMAPRAGKLKILLSKMLRAQQILKLAYLKG